MRTSVVRLIAFREIRDLLRDRRSVFMVFVLPVILYPLFGAAGLLMIRLTAEQIIRVGVIGGEHLPSAPPLVQDEQFVEPERKAKSADGLMGGDDADLIVSPLRAVSVLAADGPAALRDKTVDVLLTVPDDFVGQVAANKKPVLTIEHREGEEKSKLASRRLRRVVEGWAAKLREERFAKLNLPKDFDQVLTIDDPASKKSTPEKAASEILDNLAKVLPFILLMWLVAGAIQPAVDLTAGEKERGTMETLLISPADRSEIVFGKFIAVTLYSFASVVWNVIWLTIACSVVELLLGHKVVNKFGLLGCVAIGFPMAMLFSAVCLALGVFARSTKEGQYYLVPLIMVTMPLAFWSMVPGKELDVGNALIPVTGAMMLQQKLLAVSNDAVPWVMFGPVLGGLTVCVAIALYAAVWQFRREGVLFREVGGSKGGKGFRLFS